MAPISTPTSLFPVTTAQFVVLVNYLMHPMGRAYNLPVIAEVAGNVSPADYQKAINKTAANFDMLFTRYRYMGGQLSFVRGPTCEIELVTYDSEAVAAAQFVRHFDLNGPALVRAGIVPYDGRCTKLLLDFHHIATDGFSLGFFVRNLAEALAGKPFSSRYRSLVDYITWYSGDAEHQVAQLRSAKFLQLQLDTGMRRTPWPSSRTANAGSSVIDLGYAVHCFTIEPKQAAQLRQRSLGARQSPFKLWYLAFLVVHGAVAARTDVTGGFCVSGRAKNPFSDAYGMLSKTLFVRMNLNPHWTIHEAIEHLNKGLNEAFNNEQFAPGEPFRSMVSFTGDRTVLDALFIFQNIAFFNEPVAGGRFRFFFEGRKEVQFGMVIHVIDLGVSGYKVHWEYSPKRYSLADVSRFCTLFSKFLYRLSNIDFGAPLSELTKNAH